MHNRLVVLFLTACVCGSGHAEAQFRAPSAAVPGESFSVELAGMLWSPSPELRMQTGPLSETGDNEVDLVQEFGIENRRFTEIRAVIKAGRTNRFRVSYLPISYQEAATLQRAFTFGDQTFDVDVPATADIEWDLWRFGYQWDFASGARGLMGFLLEVRHNRFSAELEADAAFAQTETRATVPAVGLIVRGYVHRNVGLTAELAGFRMPGPIARWISDDDLDVRLRDVDLYATVSITRYFGVQGGYRRISADYLAGEDRGDLRMKGTYFGAMVRF